MRRTLATTLVRGKTDLVLFAEILGHAPWRPPAGTACRPMRPTPRPLHAATVQRYAAQA
ncbi:hypothetical protein [Nonomuraea sp. CA-141351]|uniref:hypothetical protein n=1 Tax=Nonomuraea sp. CA-141351 TaxID=3239996 RepID=UPI003D902558